MAFLFNNSSEHQLPRLLHVETVSVGCEAWIDVERFSSRENSVQPIDGDVRTSGDQSHSVGSLTKSFAVLRKKLLRGSVEDLG